MNIRGGFRVAPAFAEIDPNVKCCFVSNGGYVNDEHEGVTVVTRPLNPPDVAQALWRLVTVPDVIIDNSVIC